MRIRLGLHLKVVSAESSKLNDEIDTLVHEWMNILKDEKADYHLPFRIISERLLSIKNLDLSTISDDFIDATRVRQWCVNYQEMLCEVMKTEDNTWEQKREEMLAVNPKYVLRNHLAQEAIEAAEDDDFSICEALLEALKQPFHENPSLNRFAEAPTSESKGISLSCSS
jgi:uncharacterized protein YdiU (UPF0061 family)